MQDVLVVIDLQNGVCQNGEKELFQLEKLLNFVSQRITVYEKAKHPIIFVQHEDSELVYGSSDWQLRSELSSKPHLTVRKRHANSFFQTDLQQLLQEIKVESIEFCGAQTEYCLDGTIKFAHGLGYRNFLYRNATSTYDNAYLSASETISWYENIWQQRYATIIDR